MSTSLHGAVAVGISVPDFVPERGHAPADVYALVDYVEYGGHGPPRHDPGLARIRGERPTLRLGMHLVSTELPTELEPLAEARAISDGLEGFDAEYLVTDFGFWRLGGRDVGNLWFRPCALTRAVAGRIARACRALTEALGRPVHPENPFAIHVEGELSMSEFLAELVEQGAEPCLDVGHFFAVCQNGGRSPWDELRRVPLGGIGMAHIAGLTRVDYGGQSLWLDDHNVPPSRPCLELLAELRREAPNLRRITYEAELASTEVMLSGLHALKEVVA